MFTEHEQHIVNHLLAATQPATTAHIANTTGVSTNKTYKLIANLRRLGHIHTGPGGRGHQAAGHTLTDSGRAHLETITANA